VKLSVQERKRTFKLICVLASLFFGITARFAVSQRGYNFDFESYQLVVAADEQGLTPWQTNRYNYGPIWFYILEIFDWTSQETGVGFRHQIVLFLTFADICISFFVYKTRGTIFACLFFLNPISIIISGYHNQFDNFSIVLMCFAVSILETSRFDKFRQRDFLAIFLMGVSLATKHIFFLFIPWVALRQEKPIKKVIFLISPYLIFIVSLAPFVGSSWDAIFSNVILYRSEANRPFWNLIGVELAGDFVGVTSMFVIVMCIVGLMTKKVALLQTIYLYCLVLVAFSPAIMNQYLAIAAIGAIGLFNAGFVPYFVYSTYWLFKNENGLHVSRFEISWFDYLTKFEFQLFPVLLLLGLVWHFMKANLLCKKLLSSFLRFK
jgi:hypothetical protein